MNTVIFRALAPLLVGITLVYSIFVLLRGHNEPGGGFIGGLIAASAVAIFGLAQGARAARTALSVDPLALAGFGLLLSGFSGLLSLFHNAPFLTGLWAILHFGQDEVALSTPLVFDFGVYFVVFGVFSAVMLDLASSGEEG
jgi:multicomponent Na+:H+ antiporter subunit B